MAPWPKGVSGNPGGKPGYDVGAVIARRVLELNAEQIYIALTRALLKGNAYVFKVLAERAYGTIKESGEVRGDFSILTERLLAGRKRLAEAKNERNCTD